LAGEAAGAAATGRVKKNKATAPPTSSTEESTG